MKIDDSGGGPWESVLSMGFLRKWSLLQIEKITAEANLHLFEEKKNYFHL